MYDDFNDDFPLNQNAQTDYGSENIRYDLPVIARLKAHIHRRDKKSPDCVCGRRVGNNYIFHNIRYIQKPSPEPSAPKPRREFRLSDHRLVGRSASCPPMQPGRNNP